jgi:hypothetical protein
MGQTLSFPRSLRLSGQAVTVFSLQFFKPVGNTAPDGGLIGNSKLEIRNPASGQVPEVGHHYSQPDVTGPVENRIFGRKRALNGLALLLAFAIQH